MVNAGIEVGKSLIYYVLFWINLGAIVLTTISIITLMEDQERELRQRDVSALALIAVTIKADPNICKRLEQEEYSVIFTSWKIALA